MSRLGYMGDAFGAVISRGTYAGYFGEDDAPGDSGAVGTQAQYQETLPSGDSVSSPPLVSADAGSGSSSGLSSGMTSIIQTGLTATSQVVGAGITALTGKSPASTSGTGGGGGGGGSSGGGLGAGAIGLGLLAAFFLLK